MEGRLQGHLEGSFAGHRGFHAWTLRCPSCYDAHGSPKDEEILAFLSQSYWKDEWLSEYHHYHSGSILGVIQPHHLLADLLPDAIAVVFGLSCVLLACVLLGLFYVRVLGGTVRSLVRLFPKRLRTMFRSWIWVLRNLGKKSRRR